MLPGMVDLDQDLPNCSGGSRLSVIHSYEA
jgi:hypothetical protein